MPRQARSAIAGQLIDGAETSTRPDKPRNTWTSIVSGSFGETREPDVSVPQPGRPNDLEVERSDE